ncbi:EAL domain, c-di-GMP-specific phosphodiesterase class I (or its enzymatically inactive variant) [Vibrio xiamenensis]|uniref:EAL domain, c-di-GMP-specific phosphodiesterase class I (Or its enzymatically inactive variant) n=1 Tax=Vibrio xiamenensis TaxID=861298 RepID=A0A1G8AT19_9VIBR|nr:EAL domain-containing response regulator [Vibrio xiamenensis]SDH24202.1 EAL domain, c-di-GMP-specific phosphodiesterase class I (or its enzymatically inactive variant) [Vibrio xiamenensis]
MNRQIRVLILDDSALQRVTTRMQLERIGVSDVDEAHDGYQALDKCQEQHYDILFCDLDMPEMDGIHFLKRLSRSGFDGTIGIQSGIDATVLKIACIMCTQLGFKKVVALPKPVPQETLAGVIKEHIDAQELEGEVKPHLQFDDSAMASAFINGEFQNYYQPKYDFKTEQVVGVEVLMRWIHPTLGIIGPDVFLPLIDKSNLQNDLFFLSAEQAFAHFAQSDGHYSIALNATQTNLETPNFVERLLALAHQYQIEHGRIIVELTENEVTLLSAVMLENIARLRIHRVGLSIDDFGTGYSTLLKLAQLPVTELKIDREFVASCTYDIRTQSIVKLTHQLARNLGLRVVAEGVENKETWAYLEKLGVDVCQGFLTGRPMPFAQIQRLEKNLCL